MKWKGDDRPPPLRLRLGEAAWLLPRMWRVFGSTETLGPVNGPTALVIPGFVAQRPDHRAAAQGAGRCRWRVHGWKMGLNRGVRADTVERLQERLDAIGDERPVLVVGWSLGGLFARELARAVPGRVRAVVTFGSPFSGDPKQNNVWRLYQLVARHRVDQPPIPRIPDKPPVPTLALWSRKDGLIAPRSARGLEDERDKAVEMGCTHMAFGISARARAHCTRDRQVPGGTGDRARVVVGQFENKCG